MPSRHNTAASMSGAPSPANSASTSISICSARAFLNCRLLIAQFLHTSSLNTIDLPRAYSARETALTPPGPIDPEAAAGKAKRPRATTKAASWTYRPMHMLLHFDATRR